MDKRTRRRPIPVKEVQEGTITVLQSVSVGKDLRSEEVKNERIAVREFQSAPAYVTVKTGATKNLGDFESLRVDVSVSMPCYPEEVDRVVDEVAAYVGEKLEAEILEYIGGE